MIQKDYWNDISSNKEFTTPFQSKEFKKYVSVENRILDVGCGYGRTLNELYEQGYRNLAGIDFAEGMIVRGNELYPYLDLQVQTSSKIDLPDQSVDAVILFAVLTCISNSKDQQNLVSEICRVLKPNGILYVNDFLLNTDSRNIKRYEDYVRKHVADEVQAREYGVFEIPEGGVFRHHDENWLNKLFVSFEEQEYGKLIFPTMNGHESNGFYYIGKKTQ
ncbi:class I SAM-dependent methyltransferase [Anaerosporobacter sp.]|uniref:class I SAM-dependent methyltransferase n=1 Tax=Anaerosporobacter sp. TaxID=1872529 RepID=UPI00286F37F3|nr:class I SAM-dependent methyltransferase [Anaerosporobacter sp.]